MLNGSFWFLKIFKKFDKHQIFLVPPDDDFKIIIAADQQVVIKFEFWSFFEWVRHLYNQADSKIQFIRHATMICDFPYFLIFVSLDWRTILGASISNENIFLKSYLKNRRSKRIDHVHMIFLLFFLPKMFSRKKKLILCTLNINEYNRIDLSKEIECRIVHCSVNWISGDNPQKMWIQFRRWKDFKAFLEMQIKISIKNKSIFEWMVFYKTVQILKT